jgi:CRP/FNR family transcriptional regulator, cyclic AMP receptor protein
MASLRNDAKVALLKGVPLFEGLSKKELAAVTKATEQLEYREGQTLGEQGTRANEAFVVVSGAITVRRNGKKVATLGPGEVVGEMSLLDGEPRSADLIANEDSTVLYISRREFNGLLEDNAKLSAKVLRSLAQRLRETDRRLYD